MQLGVFAGGADVSTWQKEYDKNGRKGGEKLLRIPFLIQRFPSTVNSLNLFGRLVFPWCTTSLICTGIFDFVICIPPLSLPGQKLRWMLECTKHAATVANSGIAARNVQFYCFVLFTRNPTNIKVFGYIYYMHRSRYAKMREKTWKEYVFLYHRRDPFSFITKFAFAEQQVKKSHNRRSRLYKLHTRA